MDSWIVLNNSHQFIEKSFLFKGNYFSVSSDLEITYHKINDVEYGILLDGYILPKIGDNSIQDASGKELILKSFNLYQDDFIKHVKGVFVLLIFSKDSCSIYSDPLGLKKALYSVEKDNVIFSNNIWEIKNLIQTKISPENIAINSLFNHYIEGKTIFDNICYSKRAIEHEILPAGMIEKNYFDIKSFFDSDKHSIDTCEFAEHFQNIVNQYIDLLKIKNPAVTLTGGFDSRIMLASLLSRGIKPTAFNYGNPASKDVIIANQICEKFQLPFFNNKLENPSADWFDKMADIIVEKGQSITQIHRVHRLDTIIKLTKENSVDAVFGGYMGGEGILGIYYDDLIVSEFVRRKWKENENNTALVSDILSKKFIKLNEQLVEKVLSVVESLPYFSDDLKLNQFLFSYMTESEVHHIQDVNLYSHYVKYSIPIYLDLDYLELLFSSKFNFLFKNNESRNPLTRINYYRFYAEMIKCLYPSLGSLPLAKQGYYTPDEYLSNKLVYISKRIVRHLTTEQKYLPNFQLGQWMNDFVEQSVPAIKNSEISDLIDIEKYITTLQSTEQQVSKEFYWQKFTDIIMADKNLKYNS